MAFEKPWHLIIGTVQLFLTRDSSDIFLPVSLAEYDSDKPVGSEQEWKDAQFVVDFLNEWERMHQ